MAMHAIGSGPDFGSLHALLGSSSGLTRAPPAAVPPMRAKDMTSAPANTQLPMRPQRNVLKEGTVMNKKLAFRMLKQLGCEVKRMPISQVAEAAGEEGVPYIDVDSGEQPVLFGMLCDFGYQAITGPTGRPMIHIEQARGRGVEEVVASLSMPRPALPPEDAESWPATLRPHMDAEQERQLVDRLAVRKPPRAVVAAAAEEAERSAPAPRFRSAAEQKASLQRLQRRGAATPEAAAAGGTLEATLLKAATAPAAVQGARAAPAAAAVQGGGGGSAPGSGQAERGGRQRSPLAQIGALAVGAGRGAAPAEGEAAARAAEGEAAVDAEPCARSAPSAPAERGAEQAPDVSAERPRAPVVPRVALLADRGRSAPEVKDSAWLERLLGPVTEKPAPRTKAQREEWRARLEALSKPRLPKEAQPEEEAPAPAPVRSPRSQQEACSRLAVPRKPAPAPKEPVAGEGAGALAASSQADGEAAAEAADDTPQVVVIRSLLAECQGPLERIEEDAPPATPVGGADAAERPRRRSAPQPLARSRPRAAAQAAAPYAVPVAAPPARQPRGPAGAEAPQARRARSLDCGGGYETEEANETMLANIDQLYSSILREEQERGWGRAVPSWAARQAAPRATGSRAPAAAAEAEEGAREDGEELLESIGRLYGELLGGGAAPRAECAAPARGGGGELGAGAETPAELCRALEEVLWSSLMLGRGTGGRVDAQARLLELVAPRTLANCNRACLSAGGLPPSLLQRLAVELPLVHSALHSASCERPPLPRLAAALLRARDGLLALAGSSEINTEELSTSVLSAAVPEEPLEVEPPAADEQPGPAGAREQLRRRPKPRRTGLSHWTPECLSELGPPRRPVGGSSAQ